MLNYRSFFVLLLLMFFGHINAQTRVYDVIFLGDSVGQVIIQKKILSSDSYSLHFISNAQATLLFIKTITKATTDIVFKNGILTEGHVYRKKNKDIQELFYTWDGSKYNIKDDDKDVVVNKAISFCTANFFVKEPIGIKEVFVERFNYFVQIENLGNHKYITKVDGGTNVYSYKNGILQSIKSTKGLSVYMKLRND